MYKSRMYDGLRWYYFQKKALPFVGIALVSWLAWFWMQLLALAYMASPFLFYHVH